MKITELLTIAVKKNASDLHIVPGMHPLLRMNGNLIKLDEFPILDTAQAKDLVYQSMSPEQREEFESKLVREFALELPDIGHFRVSALHQMHGVGGVYRIIPASIPALDELGLPAVIKALVTLPSGLIIVSGPTGSGKSTTLAAMVDFINATQASHIITLEDPIEYVHQHKKSAINQIQIGRDAQSIDLALRSSLRQDPDVILIGELRDLETIRLALTAAETGHLVMTTLHASTSPHAISRIIDVFPTSEKNHVRNLLAENLQAVLCQDLVKRNGGGRIAAFEIMLATAAIRHLIRQDMHSQMESTIQTSGDIGMCTLEQHLNQLVSKRLITTATAKTVIASRGSFLS